MAKRNKIKVAMLGPYLSEMGGVTAHIRKLAKYLCLRRDIELHLITLGDNNGRLKEGELTIHVVRKALRYPFFIPSSIRQIQGRVREINPDIVHAQGTLVPYSTAAVLARDSYPALLTVHGFTQADFKFHRGVQLVRSLLTGLWNERYVISKIPNIIAVSPAVGDIIGKMTDSRVYIVPNGIDFEDISHAEGVLRVAHQSPSVLFMGGATRVKGIDVLLKAIPIVKAKIPDVHVYVAGSGSEEAKSRKLAQYLNITQNVEFLGFISGEEKCSYYKLADVFVLPSLWESAPVVLLEALAYGKPVVASNVGGIPDMLEDGKTGLLFRPGNADELARKLIILLQNNELRNEMGRAGRQRAEEFTWDKIADMTVKVYREILLEQK